RECMCSIQKLFVLVAGVAAIASSNGAVAQEWPSRSIVVVSPFASGTTNDIVAHAVLDPAGSLLGQSFVLENRPGAGGTLAVASVVKANPDGYSLLLATSTMTAAVILRKSLPYDALRDLDAVA